MRCIRVGRPYDLGLRVHDPRHTALLHSAIGPPKMATPTRPEATQQASYARFAMILHEVCRACSAGLGSGEDASRLNATVRIGVCRLGARFDCEDRRRAIPGRGL